MKILKILIFFLPVYSLHGTWLVSDIYNKSDAKLGQAVRSNGVEIQSISQCLQDKQPSGKITIGKQKLFGTIGGCKIVGQTPDGKNFTLIFLGDPTNRVANGRAPNAQLDSRIAAGVSNKGMMARVIMEIDGEQKLIGSYCGYELQNQPFNITLTGSYSQDNPTWGYTANLVPVN